MNLIKGIQKRVLPAWSVALFRSSKSENKSPLKPADFLLTLQHVNWRNTQMAPLDSSGDPTEPAELRIRGLPQKMPFMSIAVDEIIASTADLSPAEFGAYGRICLALWRSDGKLLEDDAKLARVVGMTRSSWLKIKQTVLRHAIRAGGSISEPCVTSNLARAKERSRKAAEAAFIRHGKWPRDNFR